jgi:hypothetical protein
MYIQLHTLPMTIVGYPVGRFQDLLYVISFFGFFAVPLCASRKGMQTAGSQINRTPRPNAYVMSSSRPPIEGVGV